MTIRPLQEKDFDELHHLYRQQSVSLPFHHNVCRAQFERDLLTPRFLRNPSDHHARAKTALVATKNDRVCAFVSGGMVTNGDEVVQPETGYIQAVIGEPSAAPFVRELLACTVKHIRRYRPKKIVAQDGCLSPIFFAGSASTLSSRTPWIGQALLDTGFDVCGRSLRLVAPLDRRRHDVEPPDDFKFLHTKHEMHGVETKYDVGCLLSKAPYQNSDGVVWCGNFYSGAFVKGSAYRSLYINWFTLLSEAYRGQGLGKLMLKHCLYEAQKRGAKYASLLTADDNFVARNLYHSEGFQLADVTHSFQMQLPTRS